VAGSEDRPILEDRPASDEAGVLSTCRVVLVGPRIAANLGAVARVMRNMGLHELVMVAPVADPADPRARLLATHSEDILDRAVVTGELGQALAGCGMVAATSARVGGLFRRQSAGTPAEIMPRLVESSRERPAALVFGPESSGLDNDEVSRCHYLIHIPTDPQHPALNLAQAVAICLYELRRACLGRRPPQSTEGEAAPFEAQEFMFAQLRSALEDVHFLYGPKADSLMHGLRHLLGRAQPTPMEVNLLLGLARQLRWIAEKAKHGEPGT
jgi:tRNA/rRNA methyltransferase